MKPWLVVKAMKAVHWLLRTAGFERPHAVVGKIIERSVIRTNGAEWMKRLALLLTVLLTYSICLAGAWGPGTFDNDDALDWVHLCTESKGSAVIASAFKNAMQPGTLQAPEGAAAVAAAEVVAAAKGKPSNRLPEELSNWLDHQPKQEIAKFAAVARKALTRVKDPHVSELGQLWEESADKQWAEAVAELEARLR